MQIAILVEQMRREGYEVLVSRPEVIYRKDAAGGLLEPIEKLFLEIPKDNMGAVMENLSGRKAEITSMDHHGDEVTIEALIPMRGLIGFETDLVNTDARPGGDEPFVPRIRAGPRRNYGAQKRFAGQHGGRRGHGLRLEHGAGTRPSDG